MLDHFRTSVRCPSGMLWRIQIINWQVFSILTPVASNLFVPRIFPQNSVLARFAANSPLNTIFPNTLLHYNSVNFEVVGTATCYGLGGPGIESRWGARFSAIAQTGPGSHTASCTTGTGSLSRGRSGRGVALTTHPHLAQRLKKEYTYNSNPLLGFHGLF